MSSPVHYGAVAAARPSHAQAQAKSSLVVVLGAAFGVAMVLALKDTSSSTFLATTTTTPISATRVTTPASTQHPTNPISGQPFSARTSATYVGAHSAASTPFQSTVLSESTAAVNTPPLWMVCLMGLASGMGLMRWAMSGRNGDLSPGLAMVSVAGTEAETVSTAPEPLPPVEGWIPVPRGPEGIAQQCLTAALNAYRDGILRQKHEMLLPLIGATDLDDWPGGVRQQFKAILPMMEQVLNGLKKEPGLEGPLEGSIIDQADAVGKWEGDKIGAVVFPTAEVLPELKRLAAKEGSLNLIVMPQWQGGQVVSDFGIGPWRKKNEEFVESFPWIYYCRQVRINGDTTIVQRSYPGKWQIHVVDSDGNRPCVAMDDEKPSYKRLEEVCRRIPGSMNSKSIGERLVAEWNFNIDSLQPVENYKTKDKK